MEEFADQFHREIRRFITAMETAHAVAIDTEFSMANYKPTNPFLPQEELFEEMKSIANAGQLLEIGMAAVEPNNKIDTFSVYVGNNDSPVNMSSLKFLLSNGFDIYKYFRQQFKFCANYEADIAVWRTIIQAYEECPPKEGKPWRETEDIIAKAEEMINAGQQVDFEMHLSKTWYFEEMCCLESLFKEAIGKRLLVCPILFSPSSDDKVYLRITECDGDIKERLVDALSNVEIDIKHITLVFDAIKRSNALVIGFSILSDLLLIHNVILNRQLIDIHEFLTGISSIIPHFLDLEVALQHPLANKEIEKSEKQRKLQLRSRSLTGYYAFLLGSKAPSSAHSAETDALMTIKVYEEVNALYALQGFELCEINSLYNVMSIFGSFTSIGPNLPNLYPIYPLYFTEKVKTPEAAIRKAVDGIENVFANVVHGARVGQIFVDSSARVRPVRLSSIFNNQGRPRRFFGWLAHDGLLTGTFGRIITPSAARKLHDMLEGNK